MSTGVVQRSATRRAWTFTSFAEELVAKEGDLFGVLPDNARFICWQIERCPQTQRKHVQGYVHLKNPRGMSYIKSLIGDRAAHLEIARGTDEQNEQYCSKPETRVAGPWKLGEAQAGGQGARTDLASLVQQVVAGKSNFEIAVESPEPYAKYAKHVNNLRSALNVPLRRDQVEVIVLYGTTGIGKTWSAFAHWPALYRTSYTGSDIKWWDGYDGEDTILLDEFEGQIPIVKLLQICDPYPLRLEIKGGWTAARWTRVIITSNIPPTSWYAFANPSQDAALQRRITAAITGQDQADLQTNLSTYLAQP